MSKLTVQDVYQNASGCAHFPEIDDDILTGAKTIYAAGKCSCTGDEWSTAADFHRDPYCDTESFALALLANGRFLTIEESSDTTGHGCQCSGVAQFFDNLGAAIHLGLSTDQRTNFLTECFEVKEKSRA